MLRLGAHCAAELAELAAADDRIWALDGDLADSDGADCFAARHPDRFLAAGIAEQSMVSMAAGMASCGLRPWVFSFAAFLTYRAYDQMRVCVSQARQPVALVGSHAGGCAGPNGKTHACVSDIAAVGSLGGVAIWAPAGPEDARYAVRRIAADGGPAYLRLPRRPVADLACEPAPCCVVRRGGPTVLLGTGLGTHLAVSAADVLAGRGIDVTVVHCQQVAPLPAQLDGMLAGSERVFVVEDHATFGGLASLLAGRGVDAEVVALGWPPGWDGQSGDDEALLARHGLDAEGIAARVEEGSGCSRRS
jgi:transketolase